MVNVLVVASHPDDEILGVGGAIASHVRCGDVVHIAIMAEGATSRSEIRDISSSKGELLELKIAAKNAAKILGAECPVFLGLPDNRMDSIDLLDVIKEVEKLVKKIQPDVIYTHHGGDLNVDHRVTFEAVLTATRPMPNSRSCAIYSYETASSTEWASREIGPCFRPQRYVDISDTLEQKLAALTAYDSEMRKFPHARSIRGVEALARLRGSQAGYEAAEAFMLVREKIAFACGE